MDTKHQLDAPSNDELRTIEQLDDHSGLSTLYPQAHDQYSGELMSNKARADKRDQADLQISRGIVASFLPIGALVMLPLALIAVPYSYYLSAVNQNNQEMFYVFMFFGALAWLGIGYLTLKSLYAIFYKHALDATPYLVIHVVLLALAVQAFRLGFEQYLDSGLLLHVVELTAVGFVLSSLVSVVLLHIWTVPGWKGIRRLAYISGVFLVLAAVIVIVSLL